MKLLLAFTVLCLSSTIRAQLPSGGTIWAVLVAGSNTYSNYRHQADVCHAYQILRSHGIPDSNIITMMFDDIANNPLNPRPGEIINDFLGPNVYDGVLKDYTAKDVTPQNFINILLGNSTAMKGIGSGKVLQSGPNDHVFINFVDHGSVGLVAFPYDVLYVNDWIATLRAMHTKGMYGQMTVYMETCEAGSMFQGVLPDNINIYATTAANAVQSSYACYWDPVRQAYLGDLYSVNWMENSDKSDLTVETLAQQFAIVVNKTNLSNPQQYGDLTINQEVVGNFQGLSAAPSSQRRIKQQRPVDAIPSPEVPVEILKHKLQAARNKYEKQQIQSEIDELLAKRQSLDQRIREIVLESVPHADNVDSIMESRQELKSSVLDCYKKVVSYFSERCYTLPQNNYALRRLNVFANMCLQDVTPTVMINAMDKVCDRLYKDVN